MGFNRLHVTVVHLYGCKDYCTYVGLGTCHIAMRALDDAGAVIIPLAFHPLVAGLAQCWSLFP